MFLIVLLVCKRFGVGYKRTTSQAFTGASNNFEVCGVTLTATSSVVDSASFLQLAIAVAVASYGAESPQALAATVGPLIECVAGPFLVSS